MMTRDELRAEAQRLAKGLGPEALEPLRVALIRFFARVPPPPLYRRRADPARAIAVDFLVEGKSLLARGHAQHSPALTAHLSLLELHLESLSLVAEGRVELAEEPWSAAKAAEARLGEARPLWRAPSTARRPVFESESGRSRYDAAVDGPIGATLVCPSCRVAGRYGLPQGQASHSLRCVKCQSPFEAYVGEAERVEIVRRGSHRRYRLALKTAAGESLVELDDASPDELAIARGDMLALLYRPASVLRGVLNLSSSHVLWLANGGPCFIATAVFEVDAAELVTLRRVRDVVLLRSRAGAWLVGWYYRRGPHWARRLSAMPRLRAALRLVLRGVHQVGREVGL